MIDLPHKIRIPQRPSSLIARPRLTDHLRQRVAQRQIVALAAPTGYGKTSLLIDFCQEAPFPVCWYTLDSYDADPWMFVTYLAAAVSQRFLGATNQTDMLLTSRGRPLWRTAVVTLTRELAAIGFDFLLIIDDWHLVESVSEISNLVADVAMRCPNVHLLLASRSFPSLPNGMLLTARRQFDCLDEVPLRFDAHEIAALITADGGPPISEEQAQALVERTDGWITGVLLALQAAGGDIDRALNTSMWLHRSVQRLLDEQIFNHQPPELHAFLCATALLDEMSAERCDALLGRTDSAELLETVLAQRLFAREVAPGVLRYHPLFRELLLARFRRMDMPRYRALALRVAEDHARRAEWSQALGMCIKAGELDAARQMLAVAGEDMYTRGRLETLEHIFTTLPPDSMDASLLCLQARIALDRGRIDAAQQLADQAAQIATPEDACRVDLLQALLARVTGRYDVAMMLAERIVESKASLTMRGAAMRTLAIGQHRTGQTTAAVATLHAALELERREGNMFALAQTQHDLAICYNAYGDLRAAEDAYLHADATWAAIGNIGLRALCANGQAVTQHLTGRTREASATLQIALRQAHKAAVPQYLAAVYSTIGDIAADLEQWSQATEAYDMARRIGGSAYIMAHIAISQVRLLVQQRRYAEAERALAALPEGVVRQQPAVVLLVRAQLMGALGEPAAALGMAQQAIDQLVAADACINLARAHVIHAALLAAAAPLDVVGPSNALRRAVALTERIGHDAVLVLATLPFRPMLRRCADVFPLARAWLAQHQELRVIAQVLAQPTPRPLLVVRDLGSQAVLLDGRDLDLGARKERQVLAYLLAHPDGATSEALQTELWPEAAPRETSRALYNVIYRLRSLLPPNAIVKSGQQCYSLNRNALQIVWDVAQFRERLASGHAEDDESRAAALWEAIEHYHGTYLPYTDAEWCAGLRADLEESYRHALRQVAIIGERQERMLDAHTAYQRLLTLDPCDEDAHAGIMRCHLAMGNRSAAITQFHRCCQNLSSELGLAPDPASEPARLFQTLQTT